MDIRVEPGFIKGKIDAPPSKSFAHRLLVCAALSDIETIIQINELSEDILSTIRCLEAMGCNICFDGRNCRVTPIRKPLEKSVILDCGESGSTARFLLPLAAHLFETFTLTGSGKLPDRPFAPLCRALSEAGCGFNGDRLPLTGTGGIRGGDISIPGDISSQFISGLLFVLPLLDEDSHVVLTTPLESAAYVEMTIETLETFGIDVEFYDQGFYIPGNQRYISPGEVFAEGDWSNSAFFLCMGALSGIVTVNGLLPYSTQGDHEIMEILRRFGADVRLSLIHDRGASVESITLPSCKLSGIEIDASQIPDLVPVLSVVASVADGETMIYGAGRLRLKESDRIESTHNMLSALGADINVTEDGLMIRGVKKLRGGQVDGAGDHRIVMAAATAACVCETPVIITGAEAVDKSYPSFFDVYKSIGGEVHVVKSG